jgi:uncharacterized protein (DUF2147 family)
MIRSLRTLAGVLLSVALSSVACAGDPAFLGRWARGDGKARINVAPCGGSICATNTWVKAGTPHEKTGDKLIMRVKSSGPQKWSGTAFDPQRNLHYSMYIRLASNSMTSEGCMLAGLLCRHMSWTRLVRRN